MRVISSLTAAAVAAAAIVACREPPGPGEVLVPAIAAGDAQVDTVGQQLPQPIAVRVNDANARPVYGLTVTFRVASGGGTVAPETAITKAGGLAQARWTLGTSTADLHSVEASVIDPRSGGVVGRLTFRATARADRPTTLRKYGGDAQTGDLGAALPQPIAVQVLDRYGNGVPGVTVFWNGGTTSGTLSPPSSLTDAAGVAGASWTLGLSLVATPLVTATAFLLGTVTFSAVPRLPAAILLETLGDSQSTMFGTGVAESVGVRVAIPSDTLGQRYIVGAQVTFAVTSGGGSITPSQVPTNANGEARARWVVGPASGTNTATVTVAARSVVLTATAMLPDLVPLGDSQVAITGSSLAESLGVRLEVPSRFGNSVVPGALVTFAVTAGGGSITPSQVLTDASGVARVNFVIGSAPGQNTATASFGGRSVSLTAQGIQVVGAASIAAGAAHSCAITVSGQAYCWGDNSRGQLGDGSSAMRTTPVLVAGGTAFTTLAGGAAHTCGLDAAGMVWCWGYNERGQLGDGTLTTRLTPTAVLGAPALTSLVLGLGHTCGLTGAGAAYCWGDNAVGQLGDGTTSVRAGPVAVAGALVFTRLAAGDNHTCGIAIGGTAYCWGLNTDGQLGSTTTEICTIVTPGGPFSLACRRVPTRVATTLSFGDLGGQGQHICGLSSGTVYCWGDGDVSLAPVISVLSFSRLSAGAGRCALTASGQASCWDVYQDWYYYGRVVTPASVVAAAVSFATLTGGPGHTCAIATAGQPYAYCWGDNASGQLGDGSTRWRATPAPVALTGP